MDAGPDDWVDNNFLEELFRVVDEGVASRNPNPITSTPTPVPAPAAASTPAAGRVSYLLLPSASVSLDRATTSPAFDGGFMGTGGNVGVKKEMEAAAVERLKRELNRVSKQMNDLKNECSDLRKDNAKKDLQIRAKEEQIQFLKKAYRKFAGKDVCSVGTKRASTRADESASKKKRKKERKEKNRVN